MKLQVMNGKQFFITLPNSVIRLKGWVKGDVLELKEDGKSNLILRKKKEETII